MKNIEQKREPRYFVNKPILDLLLEIIQILSLEGLSEDYDQLEVVPAHTGYLNLRWELHFNDFKICAIFMEEQDLWNGRDNCCYLEWQNDYQNESLEELYHYFKSFPEYVETEEEIEKFLEVE